MYTLARLAQLVDGELVGDPELIIRRVRPFEDAGEGDITYAAKACYREKIASTQASAVIVQELIPAVGKSLLCVSNPKLTFARVLQLLSLKPFRARGISPQASIGEDCEIAQEVSIRDFTSVGERVRIDDQVTIGPGCVIGDGCRIGSGTTLHAGVTLYSGVTLGERVILHSGCVVGADGFGYVGHSGGHFKIEQTGTVVIEDDVEIGANSCIDRGTFGATVIGEGCKLDNLVHVGHNCLIGKHTIIVGCVGVSGSVEIGDHCLIAGQAGISHHIKIGDHVTIMQKTAVTKDVQSGSVVSGQHCRDHREQLKAEALIGRLPEVFREWRGLQKRLSRKSEDEPMTGGNPSV